MDVQFSKGFNFSGSQTGEIRFEILNLTNTAKFNGIDQQRHQQPQLRPHQLAGGIHADLAADLQLSLLAVTIATKARRSHRFFFRAFVAGFSRRRVFSQPAIDAAPTTRPPIVSHNHRSSARASAPSSQRELCAPRAVRQGRHRRERNSRGARRSARARSPSALTPPRRVRARAPTAIGWRYAGARARTTRRPPAAGRSRSGPRPAAPAPA